MNLNHVRLNRQSQIELQSDQFSLTIENLEIADAPLPLRAIGAEAMTFISGAKIHSSNGSAGSEAFSNAGVAHLRDVSIVGYAQFLGASAPSAAVSGAYSQNARLGEAKASWSMAHPEPPALPDSSIGTAANIQSWVSVAHYGAVGDGDFDSTVAITAAFNSGASTIYFPNGIYRINGNIEVPSSVKMIKGFNSVIQPCGYGAFACNGQSVPRANSFDRSKGALRFAPSVAPVVIDKLNVNHNDMGSQVGFEIYGGAYPVVMRDNFVTGSTVARSAGGAPLFMTNYAGGALSVAGPQPAVARQLDIENQSPAVSNSGAPLAIYGMKTESNITLVDTEAGGATEVLGGLAYMVSLNGAASATAFVNVDSKTLVSIAELSYVAGVSYSEILRSTMSGVSSSVNATRLPVRAQGRIAPALMTAP